MGEAAFTDLRARVAARYHDCGRYTRGYVAWKMRLDPVHRAMLDQAAAEPFGRVLDLGCGRGQLGLALLEAGSATRLDGIDWDEGALKDARRAATGRDAAFARADLRTADLPACDTALVVDVLCQMPAAAQADLLRRAALAARSKVVARLFDPDRGWRSLVGWVAEGGLWASGAYRRASVRPTPVRELAGLLEEAGFACEVMPCWAGTPLPNVLLTARRRAVAAEAAA